MILQHFLQNKPGLSILELMVALAIFSIVFTGAIFAFSLIEIDTARYSKIIKKNQELDRIFYRFYLSYNKNISGAPLNQNTATNCNFKVHEVSQEGGDITCSPGTAITLSNPTTACGLVTIIESDNNGNPITTYAYPEATYPAATQSLDFILTCPSIIEIKNDDEPKYSRKILTKLSY
jgi:prepilin-type N-terminal cleavage/methylation domain-containing protein